MVPRRPTFRHRLFVIFIGSVTLPLLVVALATSLLLNARLQTLRATDMTNILTPMAEQIESSFEELDRIAFAPYLYPGLLDAMNYMNHGYLERPPAGLDTNSAESDYLATMQRLQFTSNQRIRSVAFYPVDHRRNVAYMITAETPGLVSQDLAGYHQADWYLTALATGKVFLGPTRASPNPTTYSLAVAIKDLDRRRDIGVLRIDATADVILDGIAKARLQAGDRILLLDSANQIRYDSTFPESAGGSFDLSTSPSGISIAVVPLRTAPWRLAYLASDQSALTTVAAIMIAVLVALGTTLVAWMLYRRELRSSLATVSGITAALHKMEGGDLTATAPVGSQDELGTIAESVNHLGGELSSLIDREYKAVIAKQSAEYRALQAQLSPHFLHNVLNDLVALSRMGERKKLEASIFKVSRLLRYSCSTDDTATVAQEVAFAEQYLYLRQLQLEGRLSYSIKLDPRAEGIQMPRLVVQPLAENSLKHGLRGGVSRIHVAISATVRGGWLELRVADDGAGFARPDLGRPSGFATMSIEERLRILSPASHLEITSGAGIGTSCLVRLRVGDADDAASIPTAIAVRG